MNENFLCAKCKKQLEKQAKFEIDKGKNKYFQEHLYIFEYEGMIRKIILDYKFHDKSYLYKTIVNFLIKNERFFQKIKYYDTIIPVPISKKRYKERGYNQSYLLAEEISKIIKISLSSTNLYKRKNIIAQSKLNKEERQKNVQGVYKLEGKRQLKDKKILLLDDIYTTGSTVIECCKTLSKANPKSIGVFTIAKD